MIGCGGGGGGGGGGGEDTTKPVITIVGDNPIDIAKGVTFTDPGATATDNVDGNITANITKVSTVDTTTVGNYSVKYSVNDAAGNKAEDKTRTVNVYEPASFQFTSSSTATIEECQASIITVSTKDGNGAVVYELVANDSNSTEINQTTGILKFSTKKLPDFETKDTYSITVKATDNSGESITQDIAISITQWNITLRDKDYGCVPSPYTGKIWLDRNIGATRLCEDINDTQCFGDYYQWGRSADGHEKFDSETNDTQAHSIPIETEDISYSKFITVLDYSIGWVESGKDDNGSLRMAEWQKSDGSTVCPDGYYVADGFAIANELIENDDNITNARIDLNSTDKSGNSDNRLVNAYNTFLKLPANGLRDKDSNVVGSTESTFLWSSTATDNNHSITLNLEKDIVNFEGAPRVFGFAIRCIKH